MKESYLVKKKDRFFKKQHEKVIFCNEKERFIDNKMKKDGN